MNDQELIKAKKQVAKMRNVLTVLKRINDDAGVVYDSAVRLKELLNQLILQDYDDPLAGGSQEAFRVAINHIKAIRAKLPSPVISLEDYDLVDYALTCLSQGAEDASDPTPETKMLMDVIDAGLDKIAQALSEQAAKTNESR